VYGVLLTMRDAGLTPAQDTIFIISQYEETGHGGVVGLPIELSELLVIDMAAIGEGQNSDEYSVTICAKDSSGPYHFLMNNKLRRLAETFNIPAKIDTYPIYSSDGSAYWRGGGAGRVALIGPGVDASHAYERTHQNSLIDTTHLMVRYLLDNEL
jgi:putative aminopeptidase FrvX